MCVCVWGGGGVRNSHVINRLTCYAASFVDPSTDEAAGEEDGPGHGNAVYCRKLERFRVELDHEQADGEKPHPVSPGLQQVTPVDLLVIGNEFVELFNDYYLHK